MQKGVYPYQYVDDWEKFNETSLPEKEERVGKDFEIKDSGKYHDLHVQYDTLLSADVSENLRNMCLKIYQFDSAKFLSTPGLASQAALEKNKVKLDLSTDINMSLMVEKGVRGGICHSIYRYTEANNKYMKDYDKNKELSYI